MTAENFSEYIAWFETLRKDDVGRVGGKNASLGEMVQRLAACGCPKDSPRPRRVTAPRNRAASLPRPSQSRGATRFLRLPPVSQSFRQCSPSASIRPKVRRSRS